MAQPERGSQLALCPLTGLLPPPPLTSPAACHPFRAQRNLPGPPLVFTACPASTIHKSRPHSPNNAATLSARSATSLCCPPLSFVTLFPPPRYLFYPSANDHKLPLHPPGPLSMFLLPWTASTHLGSMRAGPVRGGTGGTLSSAKCRLAGSGGNRGSWGGDGAEKQAGGRQLLRGGIGGAVGSPSSSPAVGSGSGRVACKGSERKT